MKNMHPAWTNKLERLLRKQNSIETPEAKDFKL